MVSGVLAMSLHAALLSVPVRNAPGPGSEYGVMPAVSMRMLARLISPEIRPSAVPKPVEPPLQTAGSPRTSQQQDAEPDGAAEFRPARAMGPAAPQTRGLALHLPGVLGDDDFFARQALELAPYPTAPVLIEYPPAEVGGGNHASELTLFIDENGKVVRIRVDGPALPPAMEAAARTAFMGASFAPGHVDGLAVRSRIRVEVLFEEGPSQAARAARPN